MCLCVSSGCVCVSECVSVGCVCVREIEREKVTQRVRERVREGEIEK